jgi:hypothetical protein
LSAREAENDRKAIESRRELESRIDAAMDRWYGQAEASGDTPQRQGELFGNCAAKVHLRYGALLL